MPGKQEKVDPVLSKGKRNGKQTGPEVQTGDDEDTLIVAFGLSEDGTDALTISVQRFERGDWEEVCTCTYIPNGEAVAAEIPVPRGRYRVETIGAGEVQVDKRTRK